MPKANSRSRRPLASLNGPYEKPNGNEKTGGSRTKAGASKPKTIQNAP